MIRSAAVVGRNAAPRRRRSWGAALVAPLLFSASCAPLADTEIRFASAMPPRPAVGAAEPARFTDSEFIADDGARLPLRQWLPQGGATAGVLAPPAAVDYIQAVDMP